MKFTVGIVFSGDTSLSDPLSHVGVKRPTYDRLLDLCIEKGWKTFVFTRRTYKGYGVFQGAWEYKDKKLVWVDGEIKADLVYDRTGGVKFPEEGDSLRVVNIRSFKVFCWDKWLAYQKLSDYMPQTMWIEDLSHLDGVVSQITTSWVVIKPYNGLQGQGVYIGPKDGYKDFDFPKKYKRYVAQEFVDTSEGINNLTTGLHDLRIAVVNKKIVWSHIRTPEEGTFKANVARGGHLKEIDITKIPQNVVKVTQEIAEKFYNEYDNPIFSLDFGVDSKGTPYIFEINDQIGFPRWEMDNRENFLKELILNFESKLLE